MAIAASFLRMLDDPAPGLVFGPHERAGVGERAYFTPHAVGRRPSWSERWTLRRLTRRSPAVADVAEFFTRHNGVRLCTLWDDLNHVEVGALELFPVSDWGAATRPYVDGDMQWAMEGCELFKRGTWRVVAGMHCEGMVLVVFFDGESDGHPLAGRMFCLGLDGILGYEEVVAESFTAFLEEFAGDPAAFFHRVGFTWHVGEGRNRYGDPIAAYVRDVRGHPNRMDWKR